MIDCGHGAPIVLIPGLQGRWEWMRPAVDALARKHRVISYSLCDERTLPWDRARGFENYVDQVAQVLDHAGLERAVIAGTLDHGNNPVTQWCASNVEVYTDPNGNIRPVKPEHGAHRRRIDGVVDRKSTRLNSSH